MKKTVVLALAMLLLFAGCAPVQKTETVFVKAELGSPYTQSNIKELSEKDASELNSLLQMDKWTEATDLPAMGLDVTVLIYDKQDRYASVNLYHEKTLIITNRGDNGENLYYYAPAEVFGDVNDFIETLK